eukprot:CFRG2803T1
MLRPAAIGTINNVGALAPQCRYNSSFNKSRYIKEHHSEEEELCVTQRSLQKQYLSKTPIIAVTAYDYPTALACEKAGVDVIVVDDIEFTHVLGHESAMMLTLDEVLHHSRAIARGATRPFKICDLPFGYSQFSSDKVLECAVRLVKDGRVQGIKVRDSRNACDVISLLSGAGIPVLAHLSHPCHRKDTWRTVSIDEDAGNREIRRSLLEKALALQSAGCFGIVLDHFPEKLAQSITTLLRIPTLGLSSGAATSGQLIHYTDVMGLVKHPYSSSASRRIDMMSEIDNAVAQFHDTVRSNEFPDIKQHCYAMPKAQLAEFRTGISVAEDKE